MEAIKNTIAGLMGATGFAGLFIETPTFGWKVVTLAGCLALMLGSLAIYRTTKSWNETDGRA